MSPPTCAAMQKDTDALSVVTRSNKANDRNHSAIADGSATAEERLPRYFAKSGYVDADPKGVKKQGGGKGNWYHTVSNPSFDIC